LFFPFVPALPAEISGLFDPNTIIRKTLSLFFFWAPPFLSHSLRRKIAQEIVVADADFLPPPLPTGMSCFSRFFFFLSVFNSSASTKLKEKPEFFFFPLFLSQRMLSSEAFSHRTKVFFPPFPFFLVQQFSRVPLFLSLPKEART